MTIDHKQIANQFITNSFLETPRSSITIDDLAVFVPDRPGASKEEVFRDRAWVMQELEGHSLNATPFQVRRTAEDGSTATWIIALYVRKDGSLPEHLIRFYPPITEDEIRAAIDEHEATHKTCSATEESLRFS